MLRCCSGRITYYTEPPETYTRSSYVSAEIVSEMSSVFDVDSLMSDEQNTLQGISPLIVWPLLLLLLPLPLLLCCLWLLLSVFVRWHQELIPYHCCFDPLQKNPRFHCFKFDGYEISQDCSSSSIVLQVNMRWLTVGFLMVPWDGG